MSNIRKPITDLIKKNIAYKQSYNCCICRNLLPPSYQIDHIIPHSISQNDNENNLQALCANCHSVKTQRENLRISQFKKLQSQYNDKLCWFCVQPFSNLDEHAQTCDHIIRDIPQQFEPKKNCDISFENFCNQNIYINSSQMIKIDPVLKIEISFYNLCIYVNHVIYKANNLDINEIAEAVDLATRSKKCSNRYTSIDILLSFKKIQDIQENDINECFSYIEENLIDCLPDRIFNSKETLSLLCDYKIIS